MDCVRIKCRQVFICFAHLMKLGHSSRWKVHHCKASHERVVQKCVGWAQYKAIL